MEIMTSIITTLIEENSTLREENSTLRKENAGLKAENSEKQAHLLELSSEYNQLKDEKYDEYLDEKEELESRIRELLDLIHHQEQLLTENNICAYEYDQDSGEEDSEQAYEDDSEDLKSIVSEESREPKEEYKPKPNYNSN